MANKNKENVKKDVRGILEQAELICEQEGGNRNMYKDMVTDIMCEYIVSQLPQSEAIPVARSSPIVGGAF